MSISRTHESTTATLDGRPVRVNWTRVTEWSYDPDYGADADGNRGMPMWSYEDQEPEDILIEDIETGDEIAPFKDLTPVQKQEVREAIDTHEARAEPDGGFTPDEPPEDE